MKDNIDEIGIRGIPRESKLLILGDWFQTARDDWKVVCYFHNHTLGNFRKALAIDLLPALIPGLVFPRSSSENKAQGWTETIKLPSQKHWNKLTFKDLPASLKRANEFSEQYENGSLYRIEIASKIYWLPVSELARMLFFHSSEVVRAAVHDGNTWQLGKAWSENWIGKIELSSDIPLRYINSLQYRKFFTWLLFDNAVETSFSSIYRDINQKSKLENDAFRWTFDFSPPDLSHCEISFAGFTGRLEEENQAFIREVRAISGLKSPDLDIVYFSHPDDYKWLERKPDENDDPQTPPKGKPPVYPRELDPDNTPDSRKKRYSVKLGRSGLNFDVELDTKRSPRHAKILPPTDQPNLEELEEQTPEEVASLQQGSDSGKGPRASVDNLDPPELIESPEKIVFFQAMLQELQAQYAWDIKVQIGDVPKKRCRTQHLVGDRPRQYCYAVIRRDESTVIQVLEIELTSKAKKDGTKESESLSTLFFRCKDIATTYQSILDELMTSYKDEGINAMKWKKQYISSVTKIHKYLGHPENKIKSEQDALASWVARAAETVLGM